LHVDRIPDSPSPELEEIMNWDRLQGQWQQVQGEAKRRWAQLTDDDMTEVEGNREKLEGKIQERYGYSKDRVKREVDDWISGM
jgi:uncharacterized protein YjbJ (UPF0337 family)